MKKISKWICDDSHRRVLRRCVLTLVCVIVLGITIEAAFFNTSLISAPATVEAAIAAATGLSPNSQPTQPETKQSAQPHTPPHTEKSETAQSQPLRSPSQSTGFQRTETQVSAKDVQADVLGVFEAIDAFGGENDSAAVPLGDFVNWADALPGKSLTSVYNIYENARELASGIEDSHSARLLESERVLLNQKQINSAKHLAASAYSVEKSKRDAFAAIHGNVAEKLTEEDISRLYDEEYFLSRLRSLGFYRDELSNEAVNKRNGVIRAQSAFNIPITAKIDLETMRALLPGTDYLPKDTITGEHPDGMWVLINKSSRILTVYKDDKVFKKFPVAIGSKPSLTPDGQFKFITKYKNPRWGGGGYAAPVAGGSPSNPLGKRWIGLSKGGGGRYGVHGNASPNSIGTNASHGCIRMINPDVEELYEYIELGTPVWIGSAELIAEWGITQDLGGKEPVMPDYRSYLPSGFTEG